MYTINENRAKIKALCEAAGSYSIAAKLIADEMQRSLSVDAIKSWTCNPASSRARKCPEWAVRALERKLQAQGIVTLVDDRAPSTETAMEYETAVEKIAA